MFRLRLGRAEYISGKVCHFREIFPDYRLQLGYRRDDLFAENIEHPTSNIELPSE
jgi:hypothetical protein